MSAVLCVDCGNTRLKWGLRQEGSWREQGALPIAQAATLEGVLPRPFQRIVACNVAGPSVAACLAQMADRLGVVLEWVRSLPRQCGVVNLYESPMQLGADRWAALIGARHLHPGACLVVNGGTATTVDMLSAEGEFRGGLILPGLTMMGAALAAGTAALAATAGEYRSLPRNTADAIASGCLDATLGAIERMFARLEAPADGLCLLSGGAAPDLASRLSLPHRRVENLVLEGLARIAEA